MDKNTFTVDDVGGAIGMNHIDLYWGEDDPKMVAQKGIACRTQKRFTE